MGPRARPRVRPGRRSDGANRSSLSRPHPQRTAGPDACEIETLSGTFPRGFSRGFSRGFLMRTLSAVRKIGFVATVSVLGGLLAAGLASSHDMAAMEAMNGASDANSMNHTMAP